jgi:formylglycine-generating enzyme required for sulfatase activity
MGAIWQICQKLDGAISSYRKAFEIYSSQGNVLEAAQIQLTLGQLQESAQKLDDALAHYEQAKQLYIAQNNQSGVARAAALIAKISSSISLGSLNSFEFKTITVDLQGNVMNQAFHTARYFAEALSEQISLEMIAIPGGEFRMGALEPEGYVREQPQRQVILSSFFLGKYPVTQAQWQIVANLPKLNRDLRLYPAHFRGENRPVESISWYDAVEFCDRLSRATQRRYRLPTEAEWEYACRAGTTTPFHFGATITTDLANYCGIYDTSREWSGSYGRGPKGEYRQETTPVDHFGIANAFGLCDMHGNVWEWCLDHWHHNYQGAPIDGSAWLSDDEDAARVIRGGSWDYFPRYCRSAYRFNNHPVNDSDSFGFRLVCVVPRILP